MSYRLGICKIFLFNAWEILETSSTFTQTFILSMMEITIKCSDFWKSNILHDTPQNFWAPIITAVHDDIDASV